jgi:molybdopterin molybdotransferase
MMDFDEALALLADNVRPIGCEQVELAAAHGRVLAEDVHAAVSSPRRAVSAMDGFALRDVDAGVGARLRITGKSFPGSALPLALSAGECMRIFTGAALPDGADRVIMQENCAADGAVMTIVDAYGPGWHVRHAASDFAEGDLLLKSGTLLDPRAIVALAGADRAAVQVAKRLRVAIIATGDELAPPGSARDNVLKIPESVSFGVAALVEEYGGTIEARLSGSDDFLTLRQLADKALAIANVVVVTGGASVGERDFAKAMFAEQELELLFSKVAIKPGKPVWVGRSQGRWVVGLPGNPGSAMVTARLFLAPLLGLLQGRPVEDVLDWVPLPAAEAFPIPEGRTTFVRAVLSKSGLVPLANQDSSAQAPLGKARWLVRRDPPGKASHCDERMLALAF